MKSPTDIDGIIVEWTLEKLIKFKAAYRESVLTKHETFNFGGHEYFTGYAKFLIEYLEQQLAKK